MLACSQAGALARADESRGRLRAFLLGSVKNFLSNEYRKMTALKRGGGSEVLSIDHELAEGQFALEIASATTSLIRVRAQARSNEVSAESPQIRDEYSAAGKADLFDALEPSLLG